MLKTILFCIFKYIIYYILYVIYIKCCILPIYFKLNYNNYIFIKSLYLFFFFFLNFLYKKKKEKEI